MNVRAGSSEAEGKGLIAPPPFPDFGRTINPISIKVQIIPAKIVLPPRIFRPSYGPEV